MLDRLIDDRIDQETQLAKSEEIDDRSWALKRALTVLNEREHRIFVARRLAEEPSSLGELAERFGVSRERIRQIEQRAFEKMQEAVKSHMARME